MSMVRVGQRCEDGCRCRRHAADVRERQRQAALGNTRFKGHKHSAEAIKRIRQAAKAKRRPPSQKTREQLRRANKGKKLSLKTREKIRQARLKQHFPQRMTSIEGALYREFKKRRLKFEMHKTMFGRWQPDFVFEDVKLIVQADGDYWHRQRPGALERDARFNEAARAADWTVWRFAETEIEMHPEACARAVARFVRSH